MFINENKSASLALLLNAYEVVIMDTCSLMEDSFPAFADILCNAKDYFDKKKQIVIYKKCIDELNKHAANQESDVTRIAAKRALKILKAVRRKRLFDCKKSKNDNFADNVIYTNVSIARIHSKVLIITQDKKLTDDLNKLNNLDSQLGRKVSVYRIGKDGTLEINRGVSFNSRNDSKTRKEQLSKLPKVQKIIQQSNQNNKPAVPNVPKKAELANEAIAKKENVIKEQKPTVVQKVENKPAVVKQEKQPVKEKVAIQPEKAQLKPVIEKPKETSGDYRFDDKSILSCLNGVASKASLMFRDPSIPYLKMIHGPLDLTSADRDQIVQKLEEGIAKGEALFETPTYSFAASKGPRGYRVSLTIKSKPESALAKQEAKPIPAPKKAEEAPLPKQEEPQKQEAPQVLKKKVASKKPKAEKPAAEPQKEEVAKAKPAPKKPAKPKKETAAKAVTEEKKEDKPAKAATPKKAKPVPKASQAKIAEKQTTSSGDKKLKDQKTSAKETALEKALKAEPRLSSVLSNDTYPKESKIADIQKQLTLIAKVKKVDREKLKLSQEKLKTILAELGQ